uniref:Uncharacterized protein n=1 Tax=Sinocyclocheilus grahami TaxID=75366 RepID=A0A672MJL8_SINGR
CTVSQYIKPHSKLTTIEYSKEHDLLNNGTCLLHRSQNTVTMQTTNELMYNTTTEEYEVLNISFATTSLPATGAAEISCFIDAQLAFIATATAVGIILILLTATIMLACTVSSLKRHHRAPRPSRSNADLVSGTGYWGTERREGGIVGPCETSVLLEEVKTDGEEEEIHDGTFVKLVFNKSIVSHFGNFLIWQAAAHTQKSKSTFTRCRWKRNR